MAVPICILEDPAYCLLSFVIKEYKMVVKKPMNSFSSFDYQNGDTEFEDLGD